MKTYEQINDRIASGKAVVLTAEEIIDYVDQKGLTVAAEEVDVVTTATFGPMCSSGCFLNFGHSKPKIRMSEAWIEDVLTYTGVAAVDLYLGATQLRHGDPANMYHPGDFRYGGGHVIEDLVAGKTLQLFALSYGTDCYPLREIRTYFTIDDLNQAVMVNPRNCYQNYNVAINMSERRIYTYMGTLEPNGKNLNYCSAGQLSPLLNDPLYETIGVGTRVWLAGAHGHIYAEGTQHAGACERTDGGVPTSGAGTLALGVGVPIPILNPEVLRKTCVRDRDILAPIIDYSHEYPQNTGQVVGQVSYEALRQGEIELQGKQVTVGSLSSYYKALEIANLLADEIRRGDFQLTRPIAMLPQDRGMKPLVAREKPNA